MAPRTSIRLTLLAVLGLLNFIIVVMLGYGVFTSYQNYRNAQSLIESADVLNPLFSTQKHLAEERSRSVAAIYVPSEKRKKYKDILDSNRKNVDGDLQQAFAEIRSKRVRNITLSLSKVEADYKRLQEAREKTDRYISQAQRAPRKEKMVKDEKLKANETANDIVVATTSLVTSIRQLRSDYSRQLVALSPSSLGQMQLSSIVGEVTEYSNREYTVLAKLIADNEYPDQALQEQLALWRGRISYGWDMMRSVANSGNSWHAKTLPIIENAENDYFSTFDEIKTIFQAGHRAGAKPNYRVGVEQWIDIASQAVNSIYAMNSLVMQEGAAYRKGVQEEARRLIFINLLFFLIALSASVYLWRMFANRVIGPLDTMIDSVYKTAHGEDAKIPNFQHSPTEILKLAKVLKALQSHSGQLQKERDNAHAANLAKTEFLANISHELRTPMNVVLGLIDILTRTQVSPRQKELISSLDESAKSLLFIINDLLDFSEFETSSVKLEDALFDVQTLLEDSYDSMRDEAIRKGLQSDLVVGAFPDRLYWGDQGRIGQIIQNLYQNAVKFTDAGFVRIEADIESGQDKRDVLIVRVVDSGIGIAMDQQGRIFEKFTQVNASISRKYGGTGLGLAISKALVEMMQGQISVISDMGEGATFVVKIPLAWGDVAEEETEGRLEGFGGNEGSERVLLVEDYVPNIIVGRKYIEDLGYDCDVAETGKDALEKHQANDYSIILLDIKLTDMLGYDVARAIREKEGGAGRERAYIIGITAFASTKGREDCLSSGMDDCLFKPYAAEQLYDKIRQKHAA